MAITAPTILLSNFTSCIRHKSIRIARLMKFTLDQALQKGIEAHKSGQLEEADKYYSAILANQPDHPDANHNLGVLAVGIGKVEEALRFFRVAINAKPQIIQFWLSYIDALIKLDGR